jgi:hypothetical protein
MKDRLWMLLFGGTAAMVFGAGMSAATWGKKYLEFPTVWAQESAQIQKRFVAEAAEERQQTLLMREMLADQKWTSCMNRDEANTCKVQQDSLRRVWFVQDSVAMEPDTVSNG